MRRLPAFLFFATTLFGSIGFQQVSVPDSTSNPLEVAIWYPTAAPTAPHTLETFSQTVALDGEILGRGLPLVLISHGTGGSLSSHYDTALALAEAGFVVAALTHTGDNYRDQSYVGNRLDLTDRPRQVRRVLDYMLLAWSGRGCIDRSKIGIYGFSLGGFTALVVIGGTPDLAEIPRFCATHSDAPECQFIRQSHGDQLAPAPPASSNWTHDPRVHAAVIAAPAVALAFGSNGLRGVRVPVQLWRASNDQQAPDAWNSQLVREGLPVTPEEHVVANAGHMVFRLCSETLRQSVGWMCQDAPGFDRVAFHREFNRAVVTFFRKALQ